MDPEPAYDVLDALPDGVVIAGAHGVVRTVNRVAAHLLGVDREESVGRPLREVLNIRSSNEESWSDFNAPYDGLAIRSGIPEQAWLLPNGHEVLVTARIHRNGSGPPAVQVGASREVVSEVVVTLRPARHRVRIDRERSDLVATVAHELRSPLTGVKGFVQALLQRWDRLSDEQKLLMLNTVYADADRLSRLIVELLDVARLDTGRLSIYPRPCDAEVLVTQVIASVSAGTSRVIITDFPETGADLPEVSADPDKLIQVATNLVENAVRHGEGEVTVRLGPVELGGVGYVRLIVDDEGEGIPLGARRRVFTKFWTYGHGGGSGLGMYLVNGLVRAHGGRVEVTDGPTGGARVVVDWPVADD